MTLNRTVARAATILILAAGMAHASLPSKVGDAANTGNALQLAQNDTAGTGGRQAGDEGAPLPNGADAIKENYGDWAVECRNSGAVRECQMGQYQEDNTGRKIIAISMSAPENSVARITLLMPFGLSLADGIRLQLDDGFFIKEGRFATCISDGCLVPLILSTAEISRIANVSTMTIIGKVYGQGATPTFKISLKGFSTALARLTELAKT
ncbi:invasion associated locus B family protein [Shinella sp.]|uniref:invasion associated locus B family protein n=1 Tax=Shinella sp. TaxID=1870904 RepID=UPI0039E657CF